MAEIFAGMRVASPVEKQRQPNYPLSYVRYLLLVTKIEIYQINFKSYGHISIYNLYLTAGFVLEQPKWFEQEIYKGSLRGSQIIDPLPCIKQHIILTIPKIEKDDLQE